MLAVRPVDTLHTGELGHSFIVKAGNESVWQRFKNLFVSAPKADHKLKKEGDLLVKEEKKQQIQNMQQNDEILQQNAEEVQQNVENLQQNMEQKVEPQEVKVAEPKPKKTDEKPILTDYDLEQEKELQEEKKRNKALKLAIKEKKIK